MEACGASSAEGGPHPATHLAFLNIALKPKPAPILTQFLSPAAKELSIEEYGTDANGEPIHTLVLSARANHSNFPECKTCRAGRLLEEDAVSRKAPLEERQRCRQLRQMHRAVYRTERTQMGVAQKRANESQSGVWLEDDKLGGKWIYNPIPKGNREGKGAANNWTYHCTLQGVILTGKRHLHFILPPSLFTGNNFGLTSFVVGLHHFIGQGLIGERAEECTRKSDGGSDNVGWVTHCVHCYLVYIGTFNRFTWVRGRAGHSHGYVDGDWALAKEILFPDHRGVVGPGCMSPFEIEAKLVEGFKKRAGGVCIIRGPAPICFHRDTSTAP